MSFIFLYNSQGSASPSDPLNDAWQSQHCGPQYDHYADEGYFRMIEELINLGILDDVKVFYESNRTPGQADFVKGADCYVVPHISQVTPFVKEDSIIFVRGGFKHWHDWLIQFKGKNWLMCYAANTGRERWTWWDIVFDDLQMQNTIDNYGRYQFPFIKPVNEDIFYSRPSRRDFDICIGASNIHDKKGQWLSVELIEKFREIYKYYPRCIMPGALRSSTHTREMVETNFIRNECEMPGNLPRIHLANIFNRSKVFIHLGPGGQNDRSLSEAWMCGCQVIYSFPTKFSPVIESDEESVFYFGKDNMNYAASRLKRILDRYESMGIQERQDFGQKIAAECYTRMGMKDRVLPRMEKLLNGLKNTSPAEETRNQALESIRRQIDEED